MSMSILRFLSKIDVQKTVDYETKKCFYVTDGLIGYSICYYDRQYYSHICDSSGKESEYCIYDWIQIWFWPEPEEKVISLVIMKCKTHKLVAIYECELTVKLYPRRDHNKFFYFSDKEIIKRFITKFVSTTEKVAQDPLLRKMILLLKHASLGGNSG